MTISTGNDKFWVRMVQKNVMLPRGNGFLANAAFNARGGLRKNTHTYLVEYRAIKTQVSKKYSFDQRNNKEERNNKGELQSRKAMGRSRANSPECRGRKWTLLRTY